MRPKPLVEIGGYAILWHILKYFAHYGHREFFIALGYRGDDSKRYFMDRASLNGNMTIQLSRGKLKRLAGEIDDWTVHLADTGVETNTGGRVKRLQHSLNGHTFMLTYGDGVSNVDLKALHEFHKACGRVATVTAVRPPTRFGGIVFDGDLVAKFTEKPQTGEGWINGGFLVFEPGIFSYLANDTSDGSFRLVFAKG